ncbi:MAG: glycosyltransferase family A protein, partial [Acidobacteriota bacterium]
MDERTTEGARLRASVVVPFRHGRAALARVLAAAAASPHVLEVIVVANGHDEDLSVLSGMAGVRLISLRDACGPAIARNRGAALAQAPILVFVDADVIPHATAIDH